MTPNEIGLELWRNYLVFKSSVFDVLPKISLQISLNQPQTSLNIRSDLLELLKKTQKLSNSLEGVRDFVMGRFKHILPPPKRMQLVSVLKFGINKVN